MEEEEVIIKYKRLSPYIYELIRAIPNSAGIDLISIQDLTISKRNSLLIPIGITITILEGFYERIALRSGLAIKHNLNIGTGVIDSNYRGEIKVMMFNHGDEDYHVQKGHKITQLIITKIALFKLQEVDQLSPIKRDLKGFESLGY
jgi:dUTP pyrophosphatase